MNDRHPTGTYSPSASAPDGSYGYQPDYGQNDGDTGWNDPLFGPFPGNQDTGYDGSYHQPQGYDSGSTGYPLDHSDYGYGYGNSTSSGTVSFDTGALDPHLGQFDTAAFDSTTTYDAGSLATGSFDTSAMEIQGFGAEAYEGDPYGTGSLQTGSFDTGHFNTEAFDTGAFDTGQFDTGQFDTGSFDTGSFDTDGSGLSSHGYGGEPYHPEEYGTQEYGTERYRSEYGAAEYGAAAAGMADRVPEAVAGYGSYGTEGSDWDSGAYPTVIPALHDTGYDTGYDTEPDAHLSDPGSACDADSPESAEHSGYPVEEHHAENSATAGGPGEPTESEPAQETDESADTAARGEAVGPGPGPSSRRAGSRAAARGATHSGGPAAGRGRRKPVARRSALLTVAVPSVAVMGVAAVAAATVVAPDSEKSEAKSDTTTVAAADTALDKQLASLTADADDFADRASRAQERIDLKERLEAEKRRKAMEAARREALRPKFALPVSPKGLSAMYGQAGVNWMSLHTGIDFPVSYGTPVRAATDGTVSVKWGGAYGNMAIVTAADGTETWYCHLSSTKIRSGKVKAGDIIAYSGNSGNSTGPHLHFEVHPGGGAAVDPLQWLLGKGLDPR